MTPTRVVIAGGGIGGLALAQGLHRHGVAVTVIEPDTDLAATGGYKLHLGPRALAALHRLLPARLEALHACAMASPDFTLALRDHRGRLLLRAHEPGEPGATSLDVDRVSLRTLLGDGLVGAIRRGRRCLGWTCVDDRVEVELDDATTIEADVLVLADGAGSRLAGRLAGSPTSQPCGLSGIAARTPWGRLPPASRALVRDEPMLAIGPGGVGLFASMHDPGATTGSRQSGAGPEPVVIWGLVAADAQLPDRPTDQSPELRQVARALLERRGWADPSTALIEHCTLGTIGSFRFNAADPTRLAPWPSSRVTALGDAVHAMPPTGGQGAATAILDADQLTEALRSVQADASTAALAVHRYETRMRGYAAPAVRESVQPLRWIQAASTPLGAGLARIGLPLLALGRAAVSAVRTRR